MILTACVQETNKESIVVSGSSSPPVVGYITQDGGSGTEDAGFISLIENNSIMNFTYVTIGKRWANITSYESIVDVFYVGNKYMSTTDSNIYLLNQSTKGVVVAAYNHAVVFGVCNSTDGYAGTSATIINNELPIYNSSNGITSNTTYAFYDSFKDFPGCGPLNVPASRAAQRHSSTTEYSGIVLDNQTALPSFTTQSRWVFAIVPDDQSASYTSLADTIVVQELAWAFNNQTAPAPPSDSCTYISGDHVYECGDNCVLSSDVSVDNGAQIIINGSGTFTGAATYLKGTFNGTVQGGCAVYD